MRKDNQLLKAASRGFDMSDLYRDKQTPFDPGQDYPPERTAHDAQVAISDMLAECNLSDDEKIILRDAQLVAENYKHTNPMQKAS